MNKKEVDQFLQPLKDKPGLKPRAEFKYELQKKLADNNARNQQPKLNHWVPNLVAAALLLVGVFFGADWISSLNGQEELSPGENLQPAVSETDDADESVSDLTEEEAEELIGTAFAHYSIVLNGGGPEMGAVISAGGEYRLMGEDFLTKDKVISYLEEKYTKRTAEKIFNDHPFQEVLGKLTQPNKNYSGNLLWQDGEIQKVRKDGEKARLVSYKVPVETDGEEQLQVFELTMRYQEGWKLDEILPFSYGDNTEGESGVSVSKVPAEFTLTEEEKVIYEKFTADHNEEHLRGLSPVSVAKLYVFAEMENNQEVLYALYTDKEGYVQWTKEEHMEMIKSQFHDPDSTLRVYTGIQDGEFIESGENEGWIKFYNVNDSMMGFQMRKDEDGIWNVGFMPIQ